jgi:cytosine permease
MTHTAGWIRRVGPWVGIGTSPVALMVGGGAAEGVEGGRLVAAILVGVAALTALAVAQGVLGQRRRQRLLPLAARSLGQEGSRRLASPVLAVMMVGWFAFNTGVAGAGLGRLVGIPDRLGTAIFAALMLAVAWYGLDALSWVALAAGVATVALAADGVRIALSERDGPLLGDGVPAGDLGFLPAVAIMVGYGAAFALRTPDFTWDLGRPRHVAWCGLAGLALPLAAFAVAGAILEIATGTWDLVELLERLGSPTVAYAFVAVGFTGSVLTNLHSGALSLQETSPRVGHRAGLVLVAVAGTALAMIRLAEWMVPYLTALALAAPCLIGVLWLDEARGVHTRGGYRRLGVAAWAAGVAVGLGLYALDSPAALPAGLAAAAAVAAAPLLRRGRRGPDAAAAAPLGDTAAGTADRPGDPPP